MALRSGWVGLGVVLAVAAPAAAKADRTRTVSADYITSGGITGIVSGDATIQGKQLGAVKIYTNRGEYAVDLTATDRTPLPVAFEAAQDTDGDGAAETVLGTFCGSAKGVGLKRGGVPVLVYVLTGPCGATGASAPTTGTVSAVLRTKVK
jgi:hypothetical protein